MTEPELAFFKAITSKLTPKQVEDVLAEIEAYDPEEHEGFFDVMFDVLTGADLGKFRVVLQLEVKSAEELEWQANALARTHGLEPDFKLDGEESGLEGLETFNDWLAVRQFAFLQYKDLSDQYRGFICRKNQSGRVMDKAEAAGIPLRVFPPRPKTNRNFAFVRRKVSDGFLRDVLKKAHADARKKGYRVILYLTAPDCEPCQAFERLLDNPTLSRALRNTYIIRMDAMLWSFGLRQNGIPRVRYAPSFAMLTPEGEISQNLILDGRMWEDDTARQIAEFMEPFLADPLGDVPLTMTDEQRFGVISDAIFLNDLPYIRWVVEELGCDLSGPRFENNTLLHYAMYSKRAGPEILSYLIEHGYPIDQIDKDGRNPLDYALRYNYSKEAEILRAAGCVPSA